MLGQGLSRSGVLLVRRAVFNLYVVVWKHGDGGDIVSLMDGSSALYVHDQSPGAVIDA
jgi:hypothetical protein